MTKLKHFEIPPEVIDAENSVVIPTNIYPQIRLAALKQLTILPVLALLLGGVLNLWSVNSAMLSALSYAFALTCLNVALDHTQLKPLTITMIGIALSIVLILVGAKP